MTTPNTKYKKGVPVELRAMTPETWKLVRMMAFKEGIPVYQWIQDAIETKLRGEK